MSLRGALAGLHVHLLVPVPLAAPSAWPLATGLRLHPPSDCLERPSFPGALGKACFRGAGVQPGLHGCSFSRSQRLGFLGRRSKSPHTSRREATRIYGLHILQVRKPGSLLWPSEVWTQGATSHMGALEENLFPLLLARPQNVIPGSGCPVPISLRAVGGHPRLLLTRRPFPKAAVANQVLHGPPESEFPFCCQRGETSCLPRARGTHLGSSG